MTSPAQLVQEFALAQMDAAPLAKRAALYRSLADLAATPAERKELRSLAAATAALDARHRSLVLNFNLRAEEIGLEN